MMKIIRRLIKAIHRWFRPTNRLKIIRNILLLVTGLSLLVWILLGLWSSSQPLPLKPKLSECTAMQNITSSVSDSDFSVNKSPEGHDTYIGVSDGSFIFDTNLANGEQKCEGALFFRQGKTNEAEKYWTQAVMSQDQNGFQQESNDAEALIYREDSHVMSSGLPYITFIVGTILTGNDNEIGHDVLQGAYVAQEEFNRDHGDPRVSPLQIRLLIANFGSSLVETPDTGEKIEEQIAEQIIETVKKDPRIKGVLLGVPYTSDNTIALFNQSQIPVVLSGAFSETQLQGTKYIFPVTASIEREGQVGASFVQQSLKPGKIALFENTDSAYSKNLAEAFAKNLPSGTSLTREIYIGRDNQSITDGVNDALSKGVDFIYFAGDSFDADVAVGMLEGNHDNVEFMGGDAFYELDGFGEHYKSLYFTSFAFPDEWNKLPLLQQHDFPALYRLNFAGWPLVKVYGYRRPNSEVILAYDGFSVLLDAGGRAASQKPNPKFSLQVMQGALMQIQGTQAFQGFSGRISFGFDRTDKLVLILHADPDGLTKMQGKYGCLLVNCSY
jgi:eukaryotic-like serine/threonine-protein kinase